MSHHANFAAVICIRQQMIKNITRVLYNANQIPHQLRMFDWGQGVAADFFLDFPEITFSRANADSYVFDLKAWGPMTVTLPDIAPETRDVILTLHVLAPHMITLQNNLLIFGVDGIHATLQSMEIKVFNGGPYSPTVQNWLDGPEFRAIIENGIRLWLSQIQQLIPPFNLSLLGPIVSTPNITNTARGLDGALAIGIDFTSGNNATSGDPNQLSDVTGGRDIGMWINPAVWMPLINEEVLNELRPRIEKEGCTLNRFDMTLHEGHIHIAGKATKSSAGSATFSMDGVPRLTRGGYYVDLGDDMFGRPCRSYVPRRDALYFHIQNIVVDLNLEWWIVFLQILAGIITLGIGALIAQSIINGIRSDIVDQVSSFGGFNVGERTREYTLPGDPNHTTIRLRIEDFECHTYGIFYGLTVKPTFWAPKLAGPRYKYYERLARAQELPTLRYHIIRLPFDVHPGDPQIRVRWTVRRIDNNEIMHNLDGTINQRVLEIPDDVLKTILDIPDKTIELRIECRVYRTLGTDITDLYNDAITLKIVDRLDRSHPFVFWSHFVCIPNMVRVTNGTYTIFEPRMKRRKSRIHRTDVPGRCIMVNNYSIEFPGYNYENFLFSPHASKETVSKLTFIKYLDRLPFRLSELSSHRDEVCDYCFFGGPTKKDPLPLPP